MSDIDMQMKKRLAAEGDLTAKALLGAELARYGEGALAYLLTLIGTWVYVEGVKMNYRGVLVSVLPDQNMQPAALLLNPCARVGEWNDDPVQEYEELMEGVRLIPYGTVCDVGPQQAHWKKETPPAGRRGR